ncbi:DUF4280 domain-containing protein [Flavobacterium sp.]|uniref:DUF4280 domain-containing protein n=1 Tax=Flavobacterium sp. TaxID=239 RepID=UPI0037516AD4
MAEKHYAVQGATCQCKFSESPQTDILKVKTQTKAFANDNGEEKLVATTKEIGKTLEKNTFGKCKMQPSSSGFLPCQVVITQWTGFYEKVTYEENKGNPLLESSKATCPIGGPDCITIKNHGQTAAMTQKNSESSDPDVLKEILPGVNFGANNNAVYQIVNL